MERNKCLSNLQMGDVLALPTSFAEAAPPFVTVSVVETASRVAPVRGVRRMEAKLNMVVVGGCKPLSKSSEEEEEVV